MIPEGREGLNSLSSVDVFGDCSLLSNGEHVEEILRILYNI